MHFLLYTKKINQVVVQESFLDIDLNHDWLENCYKWWKSHSLNCLHKHWQNPSSRTWCLYIQEVLWDFPEKKVFLSAKDFLSNNRVNIYLVKSENFLSAITTEQDKANVGWEGWNDGCPIFSMGHCVIVIIAWYLIIPDSKKRKTSKIDMMVIW